MSQKIFELNSQSNPGSDMFSQSPQQNMSNNPNNAQMKLDVSIKDLPTIKCTSCGHKLFQPYLVMKKLSAIQSPSGKEQIVNVQVMACSNCGNVPKEFGGEILND